MKHATAFTLGVILSVGLAIAAPQDKPSDLVDRYFAATTEAAIAASWKDWHPEATHSIQVKTGIEGGDFAFSYAMSDWETLPDWTEDSEFKDAMQGYEEVSRSKPVLAVSGTESAPIVTAQSRIDYVWDGYKGAMIQYDRFKITDVAGRMVIRELNTVFDYR